MANPETACGVPAYSSDSGISGTQAWNNYRKALSSKASGVMQSILDNKGPAYPTD